MCRISVGADRFLSLSLKALLPGTTRKRMNGFRDRPQASPVWCQLMMIMIFFSFHKIPRGLFSKLDQIKKMSPVQFYTNYLITLIAKNLSNLKFGAKFDIYQFDKAPEIQIGSIVSSINSFSYGLYARETQQKNLCQQNVSQIEKLLI